MKFSRVSIRSLSSILVTSIVVQNLPVLVNSQEDGCQRAFNIDFEDAVLTTNTLHLPGGRLQLSNVGMYEDQVLDMIVTVAPGTQYTTSVPDLNGRSGFFGQINVENRPDNPQLDGSGTFDFCFVAQTNQEPQTIESFDFTIFDLDSRGDRGFEKFSIDPTLFSEYILGGGLSSEVFVQCEDPLAQPGPPDCPPGQLIEFLSTTSGGPGDNPNNPDDLTPEQQRRSVMFTFRDTSCFRATFEQICNDGPNTCSIGGNLIFAGTASQLAGDCDTPSPVTPPPTPPPPTPPPTNFPTTSPTLPPTPQPTKSPTPEPTTPPPVPVPTEPPQPPPTPPPTTSAPVTNPTPNPTPSPTPPPVPPPTDPPVTPSSVPQPTQPPVAPPPTTPNTPNPTPEDVPPFPGSRPTRPTQPTQKSKIYSKASKATSGDNGGMPPDSEDLFPPAMMSKSQSIKNSKSVRGKMKEKKEKTTASKKKLQSKLTDMDSEDMSLSDGSQKEALNKKDRKSKKHSKLSMEDSQDDEISTMKSSKDSMSPGPGDDEEDDGISTMPPTDDDDDNDTSANTENNEFPCNLVDCNGDDDIEGDGRGNEDEAEAKGGDSDEKPKSKDSKERRRNRRRARGLTKPPTNKTRPKFPQSSSTSTIKRVTIPATGWQ